MEVQLGMTFHECSRCCCPREPVILAVEDGSSRLSIDDDLVHRSLRRGQQPES